MAASKKNLDNSWDPDTAPDLSEWPDDVWGRAQISHGGKIIREATGTLTKRGRPPVGDTPKQQVTLRLSKEVLDFFKAGGPGWQTRIDQALRKLAHKAE